MMINRTLAFAALLSVATHDALAQQTATAAGVVRDSATARPLPGTLVTLVAPGFEESVQAEESGFFRFARLKPGSYTVSARRLGYGPFTTTVNVTEQTDTISVSMVRMASMDTVRVRAGTGISGVVGTARQLQPLAAVEIRIVGLGATFRSDSSGRFFVPLNKPGVYVLRTRREGYTTQTASVTVGKDSVAEVMLLVEKTTAGLSNRTEVAWREFGDRVRLRGSSSALVSRSELLQQGTQSLIEAIRLASSVTGKNLRFGSTVCVFVNGSPSPTTPVSSFEIEMVEAVEVYTAHPRSEATNTLADQSRGYECHPTGFTMTTGIQRDLIKWVVIWLKP